MAALNSACVGDDSPLPPAARKVKFNLFGLDIGGSLAKVVYFEPDDAHNEQEAAHKQRMTTFLASAERFGETGERDDKLRVRLDAFGGTLHFLKFQTLRMDNFIKIVKEHQLATPYSLVGATGGGALKFETLFKEELGVNFHKSDEMVALMDGIHFLTRYVTDEVYYLENPNFSAAMVLRTVPPSEMRYPFLVVNMGSGVSILHVEGQRRFTRVGGTSLGGGTFLGLSSLLAHCETFEQALEMAERGDSTHVDMLVKDIYGGDYAALNLPGTVVASSFGKMIKPEARKAARPEDLVKATLITVTNNIGSIAHLHAKVLGVERVVFVGNFLVNNQYTMRALSYAMEFWSKGTIRALFLKHIGYFGCVGALTNSLG